MGTDHDPVLLLRRRQYPVPGFDNLVRYGIDDSGQPGTGDLHGMVYHVAGDESLLAAGFQQDADVPGGMPVSRRQAYAFTHPVVGVDEFDQAGVKHRFYGIPEGFLGDGAVDKFMELAHELCRAHALRSRHVFRRDRRRGGVCHFHERVKFLARKQVVGAGKRGFPRAVFLVCVPAYMVQVHVRAQHRVDLFRSEAELQETLHERVLFLGVHLNQRQLLVIARTGVNHDGM